MPILAVKNIRKSFGAEEILHGIDFSMEKGEVLSIIGSSGSGKTTLLRCMTFLEHAESGQVFVDGEKIFDAEEKKPVPREEQRRRQLNFGLVLQNFNLFPQYTVLENVCLAPKLEARKCKQPRSVLSEIEERGKELIVRVGLENRMQAYPCELSGGQQQRVAIARALAQSPKILCFDEPTSALDPELTGEVLRVIRGLAEQKTTMVIVTHEMSFARGVSDQVIFMDGGNIVETGKPTIMENPQTERLRAFLKCE